MFEETTIVSPIFDHKLHRLMWMILAYNPDLNKEDVIAILCEEGLIPLEDMEAIHASHSCFACRYARLALIAKQDFLCMCLCKHCPLAISDNCEMNGCLDGIYSKYIGLIDDIQLNYRDKFSDYIVRPIDPFGKYYQKFAGLTLEGAIQLHRMYCRAIADFPLKENVDVKTYNRDEEEKIRAISKEYIPSSVVIWW